MLPLQIKRRVATPTVAEIDPKVRLRRHVEQMPIEKQYEFVEAALQLIAQRGSAPKSSPVRERELMH